MELQLTRKYFPKGTNGELLLEGGRVCSTIGRPWKNNEPKWSCIPEGRYQLKARWTEKFGQHFILLRVPGAGALSWCIPRMTR